MGVCGRPSSPGRAASTLPRLQWVIGYDGERVYGVWPLPPDEPVIVELSPV